MWCRAAAGTGTATPAVPPSIDQWSHLANYARHTLGGSMLGLLVKFSGVLQRQLVCSSVPICTSVHGCRLLVAEQHCIVHAVEVCKHRLHGSGAAVE